MNFQIDRNVFQDGLNQVQSVVSPRTTLPVLSNVLIEADELGLKLSTTDLDVAISMRVPAQVEGTGATTLPAKRLASIVRELAGQEVQIKVDPDNAAEVKSGPSFFKILGLGSDEFPKVEIEDARSFVFDQKLFKDAMKKTSYAISTDETRYVLNGVNCVIGEGKFTLVATDGRRLAMVEQDFELEGADEKTEVIIPTKCVHELQRLLKDEGEMKVSL
ncbi:MAG: DNA polymerase III subunit beta, partial [Verrucomicrobiota bacterium]